MNLNDKQRKAVEYKNGPLLIIAGAGSGKTRTLTARVIRFINEGIHPKKILAITFTNKAAKQMLERITSSLTPPHTKEIPFVGTFHSLGVRMLKKHAVLFKRTSDFSIFDDDDASRLIKHIIKRHTVSEAVTIPAVKRAIATYKHTLLPVEEIENEEIRALVTLYEKELQENNAFDFGDLIEKPVRLLQNHPLVLKEWQQKFSHILVDEYQDVNTAQYHFVRLLGDAHRNVTAVGDDAQAIYGWRHADFRNFFRFEKDWPESKVLALEQNYRSSKNIIYAASELIKHNTVQKEKNLWTENPDGPLIDVIGLKNQEQEAESLVSGIFDIRSKTPHSRIAILYRTNAQSRAIEQAFIQADLPYHIFGGVKFYDRKEIKDIIACLRFASNPKDSISKERIRKAFLKAPADRLLRELPERAQTQTLLEIINFIIVDSFFFDRLQKKFGNAQERIENVDELIAYAGTFKTLAEFLEQVSLLQTTDKPSKTTQKNKLPVELMTIHMAKGLEFDVVFIVGCAEGLMPHKMSYRTLAELEEERRLMYVAMTRAKEKLYILFYSIPSRFLYELPPELTSFNATDARVNDLPDEDIIYIDE